MTDGDAEVASFLAKAGLTEHLEVAWFLAKAGLTFDEADMRECGLDPGQAALVRRTLQELAAVAAEARQEKPETLSGRGKSKGKGKRQSGNGKSKDKGKHSTCKEVAGRSQPTRHRGWRSRPRRGSSSRALERLTWGRRKRPSHGRGRTSRRCRRPTGRPLRAASHPPRIPHGTRLASGSGNAAQIGCHPEAS